MKLLILLLCGVLLLCGCETITIKKYPQDYSLTSKVTWIVYTDFDKLQKDCTDLGLKLKLFQEFGGCSTFYYQEKRCVIRAMVPKTVNDFKTTILGHEVLHCFVGNFHGN